MQPGPKLQAAPRWLPGNQPWGPLPACVLRRPAPGHNGGPHRTGPGTHGHTASCSGRRLSARSGSGWRPISRAGLSAGPSCPQEPRATPGDSHSVMPAGLLAPSGWGPGSRSAPTAPRKPPRECVHPSVRSAGGRARGRNMSSARISNGPVSAAQAKRRQPRAGAGSEWPCRELPPASPRASKQRGRREGAAGAGRCTQGPGAHCPG